VTGSSGAGRKVSSLDWLSRVDRPAPCAGSAALEDRAEALLVRLHLATADLRALEAEATWMVREAERALRLAVTMLVEETGRPSRPV
jgi:hypothetical protein